MKKDKAIPPKTGYPMLWGIPAVMLLIALAPLPYGYYIFLRFVVCLCAGVIAYQYKARDMPQFWFFGFCGIAILFNPIVPIYLSREIWAFIDVGVAAFFGVHYWLVKKTA